MKLGLKTIIPKTSSNKERVYTSRSLYFVIPESFYSVVDTQTIVCQEYNLENKRIATHLVNNGILHVHEVAFECFARPIPKNWRNLIV